MQVIRTFNQVVIGNPLLICLMFWLGMKMWLIWMIQQKLPNVSWRLKRCKHSGTHLFGGRCLDPDKTWKEGERGDWLQGMSTSIKCESFCTISIWWLWESKFWKFSLQHVIIVINNLILLMYKKKAFLVYYLRRKLFLCNYGIGMDILILFLWAI